AFEALISNRGHDEMKQNGQLKEKVQFRIEQDRVLVPVGQPCPFGCKYCYTRGGEVGPPRIDPVAIVEQLKAFAQSNSFETIQFGYDGDPFSRREHGVAMLAALAELRKHINFSTKAIVAEPEIRELARLHRRMTAVGTSLSAIVSLSCWE